MSGGLLILLPGRFGWGLGICSCSKLPWDAAGTTLGCFVGKGTLRKDS